MNGPVAALAVAALASTAGGASAHAAGADGDLAPLFDAAGGLIPHRIEYRSPNGKTSARLSLSRDADGRYRYAIKIRRGRLLSVEQTSEFRMGADGALQPLRWHSHSRLLGFRRSEHSDFDPAKKEIRGKRRGRSWTLPWPAGKTPLDPLLASLRMRMLACDKPATARLALLIARRGELATYTMTRRGNEMLDTALGQRRTVHYDFVRADTDSGRRVDWWFTETGGCLPVRFEHRDGDGKVRRFDWHASSSR